TRTVITARSSTTRADNASVWFGWALPLESHSITLDSSCWSSPRSLERSPLVRVFARPPRPEDRMAPLFPCPSCNRHIRRDEAACPFCAAQVDLSGNPEPRLPRTRLGRAATFAFGATIAGATALTACGGDSEDGDGGVGGSAGVSGSGGSDNTGGMQATGGTSGSGGAGATGGTAGSGGNDNTGGAGATGGSAGAGGAGATGGTIGSGGGTVDGGIAPPYGIPPDDGGVTPLYGAPP